MKLRKPDISQELTLTVDLLLLIESAKRDEMDIEEQQIKDVCLTGEDLEGLCFSGVVFENCKFINCNFQKTRFIDVRVQNCDFSNSNFGDGYFNRNEFISCKWMGTDLQNTCLQQISISGCNFQYANFDHSQFNTVYIVESDLSHANIVECKLKKLGLQDARLINTVFFKTTLKGIDFTASQMGDLIVSDDFYELRGAIVNIAQAADLAKLLGVIVK